MSEPQPIMVSCLSLKSTDKIGLICLQPEMRDVIRAAINTYWSEIQSEKDYHGSYEFKLRGNPWLGQMEQAVRSRSLLVGLLTAMAQNGWNLIQSVDTCKRQNDLDSLYFEQAQPDPGVQMYGLSFNKTDRIRLINAPEQMRDILLSAVESHRRIQSQKEYCGSYELKLAGNPWYYDGADGVGTRIMLCQILANFRAQGFKLYASADISTTRTAHSGSNSYQQGDLESWVFRKVSPPFWQ